MPRDIPIGNGNFLVNFDHDYNLRDIYYPFVGEENHSLGHVFHFGVWVDGQFSWMGPEWNPKINYDGNTLVTKVIAENQRLGLRLFCSDAVDFHENILVRKVRVENLRNQPRNVKLFYHYDFHIYGNEIGDTALYDPRGKCLIHYKKMRYFLIGASTDKMFGIEEYATGVKEINNMEGTWRDAEDGKLSMNPIAQGSVDSTMAVPLAVPAGGSADAYSWMVAGKKWGEVFRVHQFVHDRKPESYIKRTGDYWKLWSQKGSRHFPRLPDPVVQLYYRSLLIIRTQMSENGAIIAANDGDIMRFARDTYSYMWPRDGSLVANALDLSGYSELSRRFFDFCSNLISSTGYFLHKYNPDGSLASSWHPWIMDGKLQHPLQEDETALVIWALWKHWDKFRDMEFLKPLYRSLIKTAAEFMVNYRNPRTGLPLPSYDLWEERHGVLTFTVSCVWGGLMAAANFAEAFGENTFAAKYRKVAEEIHQGMEKYLWRPEINRFARMVNFAPDGAMEMDLSMDASMYAIFAYGPYEPNDPKVLSTMKQLEDRLWCKTKVGGMARYENDYYHQVSHDVGNVPGNPWFICTLWLALHRIEKARNLKELDQAIPLMEWVASHALPSGVLAEQVNPYTNEPLSVSPLTWSHAAFVTCVERFLDKQMELSRCKECGSPKLPKKIGL